MSFLKIAENAIWRDVDKTFPMATREDLARSNKGDLVIADIESYPDLFFVGMFHQPSGKYIEYEDSPDRVPGKNDKQILYQILSHFCFAGFNWHGYDKIMLAKYLTGDLSIAELCKLGSQIIEQRIPRWELEEFAECQIPTQWDSFDILQSCPVNKNKHGHTSLKQYAGRMHTKHMMDLPFPPGVPLNCPRKRKAVGQYCLLDVDKTWDLAVELKPQIAVRYTMSKKYNQDLRSKVEAQVAEAVIKHIAASVGHKLTKVDSIPESVKYVAHESIRFELPQLQQALRDVTSVEFELDGAGSPVWPSSIGEEVAKDKYEYAVTINGAKYKLGMGGLHSQEKEVTYWADDEYEIADNDVASFYPRIILNLRLFPKHIGEMFLEIYDGIVGSRLKAKVDAKDKTLDEALRIAAKSDANTLKIVINGLFGKFGSMYSVVYAPDLLLAVTISGQLYLLMLIERLELAGLRVISANTDGIITRTKRSERHKVREIIAQWEKDTNFETEETQYASTHSRDVNNYFAVMAETQYNTKGKAYKYKPDKNSKFLDERLGVKVKGCYGERGSALNSILSKNPENLIISDSIMQLVVNKQPVEQTVRECKDVRRFVTVRSVRGGAVKDGKLIGKVIRTYFAKDCAGEINYLGSGNKVPNSEGAKPLMDLPDELPTNLDVDRYIKMAEQELYNVGYYRRPTQQALL